MSILEFDEDQSRSLLAAAFTDASGFNVKPDDVSFSNKGTVIDFMIKSLFATAHYTREEIEDRLQAWIHNKFGEETAKVDVYSRNNGSYVEEASEAWFDSIEIEVEGGTALFDIQNRLAASISPP